MTKKEIKTKKQTPHDEYFKKIFGKVKNAKSFIRDYLPLEIVNCLDLETLEVKPETFIDDYLKKYSSDILYEVKNTENRSVFIYTLIEHKSKADRFSSLQLLKYMVEIYYKYKKKYLPIVIPILIYNGKKDWKNVYDIKSLLGDVDINLQKFVPNFAIEFRDLAKIENVKSENDLRVMIEIAKFIRRPDLLQNLNFHAIFINIEKNIINSSLVYILEFINKKHKPLLFEKLKKELKEVNLMSIAQSLRDEGRIEGKQEGKQEGLQDGKIFTARNMINKKLDLNLISEVTGLPIEKIQQIKEEGVEYSSDK
jgi:predicted transposase/invertase (TIGR01784 family)